MKRGETLLNRKKLKGVRVEKDFTQKSISTELGMGIISYHRKELGQREFTRTEIEKTAKVLELTLQDVNEIFFDNNLPIG
jgi:transcriptional regulator with XRE-family HTH domain